MPISIVLGNAEYCAILIGIALALALKNKRSLLAGRNEDYLGRIEALEMASNISHGMQTSHVAGRLMKSRDSIRKDQPLSRGTVIPEELRSDISSDLSHIKSTHDRDASSDIRAKCSTNIADTALQFSCKN